MKKAGKFIQICTTIPEEFYQEVINNNWKHSEVYKLGFRMMRDGRDTTSEVNFLKEQNSIMSGRIQKLAKKIYELENPEEKTNETDK